MNYLKKIFFSFQNFFQFLTHSRFLLWAFYGTFFFFLTIALFIRGFFKSVTFVSFNQNNNFGAPFISKIHSYSLSWGVEFLCLLLALVFWGYVIEWGLKLFFACPLFHKIASALYDFFFIMSAAIQKKIKSLGAFFYRGEFFIKGKSKNKKKRELIASRNFLFNLFRKSNLEWKVLEKYFCSKSNQFRPKFDIDAILNKIKKVFSFRLTFLSGKKAFPLLTRSFKLHQALDSQKKQVESFVGSDLAFSEKKAFDLLKNPTPRISRAHEIEIECAHRAVQLEEKLRHFGINGTVVQTLPGPVVTLYKYQPTVDVTINRVVAREDDLAMALQAMSMRIIAPIPGTSFIGFEISNNIREFVALADVMDTPAWRETTADLPLLVGVDSVGNPVVEDLVLMPHLLVAGSTGSGKSVCMHSLIIGLLAKRTARELKIILIDPKRLEFSVYANIPHLLFSVVTDMTQVGIVLKWAVCEMERRYKLMSENGVRNLVDYNKSSKTENLPYIAILVDELADLMMVAGKEVELQLVRLAQMARAAGIHLIVATQRPSVDVVTGLIKVNFPSRLACRVSSKIDSRTIIDCSGAEKLLGRGDMLFMNSGTSMPKRVHGAYISSEQTEAFADYLRGLGKPDYIKLDEQAMAPGGGSFSLSDDDPIYPEVVAFLATIDEISISMLQRRFKIGFNRSARLIEQLEQSGLLSPSQGSKPRKVIR